MRDSGERHGEADRASPLTAAAAAAMAGGRLARGAADIPIVAFSTDSRTVQAGALFIALEGDRFDGHTFVPRAIDAGAVAVLVSDESGVPPDRDAAVIVVDDTLAALQRLARAVRRASGAKVVAITGSAGKTTTKEATAALLELRYRTFRSTGNLNNHIGLPLSLLSLVARPQVAVVELGMNHAGEISTLVAIAEPDVRVWTNVAPVHTAFFSSMDAIADAKAEILEGARQSDVLVTNADDPLVMARVRRFVGRVATFGLEATGASVRGTDVRLLGFEGSEMTVTTSAGAARVHVPLAGPGNLANVLAAITVATEFGVPMDAIVPAVSALRPMAQRGRVERLAGGVTLVDDSYNSNPAALAQALAVVAGESRCGRKVAVLGEMLELGERAVVLHERSGRAVAAAGIDWLIAVGGEPAGAMARAAVAAGLPAVRVEHVATSQEAAEKAAALVRPGDLVFVKGSRGVKTERVAERIRADFA